MTIEAWTLVKIHDTSIRERSKCDDCGKWRLTTQLTMKSPQGLIVAEYLCNECLTKTPPWVERRNAK